MARDGKGGYIWYFLRKDNPGKVKKVSNKSIQAYIDTLNGKKPSGIKSYEQLTNACFSYHYVISSERRVPGCEFNAAELSCPTCKGFKLYGICSHVCAVNLPSELVHPQVAQSLGRSDNGGKALASSFSQLGVPLTAHKLLL